MSRASTSGMTGERLERSVGDAAKANPAHDDRLHEHQAGTPSPQSRTTTVGASGAIVVLARVDAHAGSGVHAQFSLRDRSDKVLFMGSVRVPPGELEIPGFVPGRELFVRSETSGVTMKLLTPEELGSANGPPTSESAIASPGSAEAIEQLTEDQVKDIVFTREGKRAGVMRYQGGKPVAPGGYSLEQFNIALARLEQLEAQSNGAGGPRSYTIAEPSRQASWSSDRAKRDAVRDADAAVSTARARKAKGKQKRERNQGIAEAEAHAAAARRRDPLGADLEQARAAEDDAAAREAGRGALGRAAVAEGTLANKARHVDIVDGFEHRFDSDNLEGTVEMLGVDGDGRAQLGISSENGVTGELSGEVAAKLVAIDLQPKFEEVYHVGGEELAAKVYLKVGGMIGAEAKGRLAANIQRNPPKNLEIDEQSVSAGVEGFAGAKLGFGIGAALEWRKKPAAAYKAQLQRSADMVLDHIRQVLPPLAAVLELVGADDATLCVLDLLFEWGKVGNVPVFSAEAMSEMSLGVGAKAAAAIGFRNGGFEVLMKAGATAGLGFGVDTKVMLDVVEGPKLALILAGDLLPPALAFARSRLGQVADDGVQLVRALGGKLDAWLSADNKARELVARRGHEVLPARERALLVLDMLDTWASGDDQRRSFDVLHHSKRKGDLGWVAETVGREYIVNKLTPTFASLGRADAALLDEIADRGPGMKRDRR